MHAYLRVARKVAHFQPRSFKTRRFSRKQVFPGWGGINRFVIINQLSSSQEQSIKQQNHGICGGFCHSHNYSCCSRGSLHSEENLQRRTSAVHEAWATVYFKRAGFSAYELDKMIHHCNRWSWCRQTNFIGKSPLHDFWTSCVLSLTTLGFELCITIMVATLKRNTATNYLQKAINLLQFGLF